MKCRNCGVRIEWDQYWTSWDHVDRKSKLTAELCDPELGFEVSKVAEP